jgi:hypothetical protein
VEAVAVISDLLKRVEPRRPAFREENERDEEWARLAFVEGFDPDQHLAVHQVHAGEGRTDGRG